jgi:hypothetical protein
MNATHRGDIKVLTNMRAQKRVTSMRGRDEPMRIRKESKMFNPEN